MKAIIIAAEGVQDVELVYPWHRLQEAGYEVQIAAPTAGPFTGIKGVPFEATIATRDLSINSKAYDLLILPGGVKAMEKLRLDPEAVRFVMDFHLHGGIIGSICSGAQLLISAGLVRGRKISAYYAMQIDVENAGGTFVDAPSTTFDRIVSSPHYRHLGPWMRAVLDAVEEEKKLADDQ